MGEKHADGDGFDRAERVMHLAQLRHIACRRIVERKQAPVAQLQDGDGGQGLGDGGPVIGGLGVDRLMGVGRRRQRRIGWASAACSKPKAPPTMPWRVMVWSKCLVKIGERSRRGGEAGKRQQSGGSQGTKILQSHDHPPFFTTLHQGCGFAKSGRSSKQICRWSARLSLGGRERSAGRTCRDSVTGRT